MKAPKLILIMLFEESRKVSFGVWLYATATWLLCAHLIDAQAWMLCMGASSALVGGGTVADKYLAKKDTPPAQ